MRKVSFSTLISRQPPSYRYWSEFAGLSFSSYTSEMFGMFQVADQVILSFNPSRKNGLPNQLMPAASSFPGVIRCAS